VECGRVRGGCGSAYIMSERVSLSRRRLLQRLALGASLASLAVGEPRKTSAASAPLLSMDAPEAKAVKYVEDAKNAQGAAPGNNCANCALYQGPDGSTQGPCQLFPGKDVKAAGWCSSWAAQL
jgi:High potential iron-sulfur protein